MAELKLQNTVTIVTGGSRVIGKGCVKQFVEQGSNVVFCSNNDIEGKATEKEISAYGQCLFVNCDVTHEDEVVNVIDKTVETFGKIDCLINNVGIHLGPLTIDQTSVADFKKIIDVNLISTFLFTKHALPYLRQTKGNVINLSSLVGQIGQEKGATYVATKGAISAMTKALAIDEAPNNVRINCVSPSNVWTPLLKEYFDSNEKSTEIRQKFENYQMVGRFCTIEEVAKACLFLATDATFCTGLDLNITGGAEINYGNKNRMTSA